MTINSDPSSTNGNFPGSVRLPFEASRRFENEIAKIDDEIARVTDGEDKKVAKYVIFKPNKQSPVDIVGADTVTIQHMTRKLEDYQHEGLLYMDIQLFDDGSPFDAIGDTRNAFVVVLGGEMPPRLYYQDDEGALVDPELSGAPYIDLGNASANSLADALANVEALSPQEHAEEFDYSV